MTEPFIDPDPTSVYDKIWKPLLEPSDDGVIDQDLMKTLLFDYGATLHNLSILYTYLTDNKITNPQAEISEVMQASDAYVAGTLDVEVRNILGLIIEEFKWAAEKDLKPEETLTHIEKFVEALYLQGAATISNEDENVAVS